EYADLWEKDPHGPRLYRVFSRALIYQSFLTLALKLARRGLQGFPGDPALSYNVALAYARAGNLSSAEQLLEPLLKVFEQGESELIPSRLRMEIVALRGRLYKDRCKRENDASQKQELSSRAAEWYLRATPLVTDDPFPLINAATMRFVSGDQDTA